MELSGVLNRITIIYVCKVIIVKLLIQKKKKLKISLLFVLLQYEIRKLSAKPCILLKS